ncbi:MAG: peptide deformylase [Pseudomonadota bacterium]|nr:peptide deformylase [Pseudomonadota bacterium]
MAIRDILRMGDARLLQVAEKVEAFDTPELHALVADLTDTMHANDGAGLAAPQIGVNLQVVVFGVESTPRYPNAEVVPFTVLINPILRAMSEAMEEGWEGCLSVPGLRGKVPRHLRLHYIGFDQYGQRIEREVAGFHARVVQHETDHLWGILYPRRIRDLRNFGFSDVLSPERTD